jgi:hypothetical protein
MSWEMAMFGKTYKKVKSATSAISNATTPSSTINKGDSHFNITF